MKAIVALARVFLAVLVCLVLSILIPNVVEVAESRGKIYDVDSFCEPGQTYDAIIVLGASVNPDGYPSVVLKDRLDIAVSLYQNGVSNAIIVSGDDQSDADYDEVTAMKNYLIAMGVPSEDVFCDHAGICTYDSMYRAQYVFNVETMVVVTQKYHLPRALFDANSLKVDSVGVMSDLHKYSRQTFFDGREVLARVSDFKKVVMREDAAFLSEPVSLDQSGDVTTW